MIYMTKNEGSNMDVLVMVPFKEHHMEQIREAAGPDANVVQKLFKGMMFKEMQEALRTYEVIIGEPAPRLLMADDVVVKWIQSTWAGVDIYTRSPYGFPKGMMLTNVAGAAYGHTISQYVVGQILAITQNLGEYAKNQATMAWKDLGPNMSLEGTNVLIFGTGDLGSHVAHRLSGFDVASITGVCRDTSKPREGFDRLVTLPKAEFLLKDADVVINCLPSSPETTRYLGARRLRMMKPGSVLVNVGRGDFIDCDALVSVLNEGLLRGAALDVTDPEPLPLKHGLWRNRRCLITPHVAGGAFGKSQKTEDNIAAICCENLRRYVAGEPLTHRVF